MNEDLLREAYDAFNGRDIDTVLSLMQPGIAWPNGFEGGYVHGHDAVREYWMRQWQQIDPYVEPIGFVIRIDGRIAVDVEQRVLDLEGALLTEGRVRHIYTFVDGLISHMQIEQ